MDRGYSVAGLRGSLRGSGTTGSEPGAAASGTTAAGDWGEVGWGAVASGFLAGFGAVMRPQNSTPLRFTGASARRRSNSLRRSLAIIPEDHSRMVRVLRSRVAQKYLYSSVPRRKSSSWA